MGLFSRIFGSSKSSVDTSAGEEILSKEQIEADRLKKENDELLAKKERERKEYETRSEYMGGGGRTGLMFNQNQAGV